MTAVEREFRLGKSVVFGTVDNEFHGAWNVLPSGQRRTVVLYKTDGWELQPLPFEFPTKRSAIVGVGNNRFILACKDGRYWYRPGSSTPLTESNLRAGYVADWFVVFEGEDQ